MNGDAWWRMVLIALCMRSLAKLLSECSGLDSWRTSGMNPANLTRCDLDPREILCFFNGFSPNMFPQTIFFCTWIHHLRQGEVCQGPSGMDWFIVLWSMVKPPKMGATPEMVGFQPQEAHQFSLKMISTWGGDWRETPFKETPISLHCSKLGGFFQSDLFFRRFRSFFWNEEHWLTEREWKVSLEARTTRFWWHVTDLSLENPFNFVLVGKKLETYRLFGHRFMTQQLNNLTLIDPTL